MDLGFDPEIEPTESDLEEEADEEPDMMVHAQYWDDFLALIDLMQSPWAKPAEDTDEYRKQRAVKVFNMGAPRRPSLAMPPPQCPRLRTPRLPRVRTAAKVCKNHKKLAGAHLSWVEHILLFVVPRQIVLLGDPTRRACDACESLGARLKKIIKHLTCRRHIKQSGIAKRRQTGGTRMSRVAQWTTSFMSGWIKQAFTRVTVDESLRHGNENEDYLLREDILLRTQGLSGIKPERTRASTPPPTIVDALVESVANEGSPQSARQRSQRP